MRPLVSFLLVLALTIPARAQLCPPAADPCVVSSNVTVTASSIDLGNRALVVNASRTITIRPLEFDLHAGSILLHPGARILAPGVSGFGGDVRIVTTGDLVLERMGNSTISRIDVSADAAGGFLDLTVGGRLQSDGLIDAHGLDGGAVTINATGPVTLGGSGVTVRGALAGDGGDIMVTGAAGITIDGLLDVSGGQFGGGLIALDAHDDLDVAAGVLLDAHAIDVGTAGEVRLHAGGGVTLAGSIDGTARTSADAGLGGRLTVRADGGDAILTGPVDLSGESGGAADIAATGDVMQGAPLGVAGAGVDGCGGDVFLHAAGSVALGGIDAHAGTCGGDLVEVRGTGIAVDGNVVVDGIGGPGGLIDIHGCQVDVPNGSKLSAAGADGMNLVSANGAMTIGAMLLAGGSNRLEYETVPPVVTTAPVPAPVIVQADLTPCGFSSTSTSTSSTSTTTTVSTSTTHAPTTSTTTTTTTSTTTTSTTHASTSTTTSTTATTSSTSSTTSTSTTTTSTTTTSTTHPSTTTTTSTTVTTSTSTSTTTTSTTTSTTSSTSTTHASTTTTSSTTATTSTSPSTTTTTTSTTTTSTTTSTASSTSTTSTTATTTSGPSTTITTSTTSSTTPLPVPTTTTLPVGCADAPSFAAVRCRLAAVEKAVETLAAGPARDGLAAKLAGAGTTTDRAEGRCAAGQSGPARKTLRRTLTRLRAVNARVRALAARGVIDASHAAAVAEAIGQARDAVRALRTAVVCPS